MEIKRGGSEPSGKSRADWFIASVRVDLFSPVEAPSRAAGNAVTFDPGAHESVR